jgi:hypothetical protein
VSKTDLALIEQRIYAIRGFRVILDEHLCPREKIDKLLTDCGWTIQNRSTINFPAARGEPESAFTAAFSPNRCFGRRSCRIPSMPKKRPAFPAERFCVAQRLLRRDL